MYMWQLSNLNGGYGYPYGYPFGMGMQREPENPFASMLRGIPAAYYSFQGKNIGPLKDIASQIGNLANAQYDESNPLYQHLYEQERGAGMQDLAGAINELSRQNRKLSSMGRTPLFNEKRGGEQIFRQLTQGYQNAQNDARSRARNILGVGQNALNNTYNAYANIANGQVQNNAMKASGFGSIADVVGSFLRMGR